MSKRLDQMAIPEIKQAHGGARPGAGRKKGSIRKEPTKAMRVPVALVPEVEKLIEAHKAKTEMESPSLAPSRAEKSDHET